MSIEEVNNKFKFLSKMVEDTGNVLHCKEDLIDIEKYIDQLQKENESLRNCGNCQLVRKKHCGTLYCSCQHFDTEANEICNSWTKREE